MEYVGAAGLVAVLVVLFVLGVLAHLGRWRSWYDAGMTASGPRLPYGPLTRGWFAAGWLVMGLMVALDALLDPIPMALVLPLGAVGIGCFVTSIVFIYPPVRLLPGWMRAEERERRASRRVRFRGFFT